MIDQIRSYFKNTTEFNRYWIRNVAFAVGFLLYVWPFFFGQTGGTYDDTDWPGLGITLPIFVIGYLLVYTVIRIYIYRRSTQKRSASYLSQATWEGPWTKSLGLLPKFAFKNSTWYYGTNALLWIIYTGLLDLLCFLIYVNIRGIVLGWVIFSQIVGAILMGSIPFLTQKQPKYTSPD